MKLGLKGRMLAILLIPAIIVVAGLSFYSYYASKGALDEQVVNAVTATTGDYSGKINAELVDKEMAVKNLAAVIGSRPMSPEEIASQLLVFKNSDPSIKNIFIGFESKQYIETSGVNLSTGYDPAAQGWYKRALESSNAVYSEVYEKADTKQQVISIVKKVVNANGQVIGVVGLELDMAHYGEIVKAIKPTKTAYAYVIDPKGNHIIHPTLTHKDNIFVIQNGYFGTLGKAYLSGKPAHERFTFNGVEKFYTSSPIGNSGWVLATAIPVSELYDKITVMGRSVLAGGIVAVVVLGVLIVYMTLKITKPLKRLAVLTEAMADGDLGIDTQQLLRDAPKDEIGVLIGTFHAMKEKVRHIIKRVAVATEQVAASSEELTASADQSAQAANQVAISITDVAKGAEDQMAAADNAAAVVEKISANINKVAANANEVAEQSAQAADKAKAGNKSVEKAINQMANIEKAVNTSAAVVAELGERSKEIGQIVDTISGIAGQTNLLALNAAIEAARAGEQGRGFAVVAEEVRKLAEQSEESAKQIAMLIGEIQTETDKAVSAMDDGTKEVKLGTEVVNESGQAFQEITTLVARVSAQIQEMSGAFEQIAGGSQQIVGSVKRIDEMSKKASAQAQNVSAATEETSASMQEMASSSQTLASLAQDLQAAVSQFRV